MHLISVLLIWFQFHLAQAFSPIKGDRIEKISRLHGGVGIAESYSWKEDQYEIELKVRVPASTKSKQINYQAKSKSISLQIGDEILLDGSRNMRGMIDIDGTFWSLLDSDEHDGRDLIITIEKLMLPPNDPFEVVEFDWGGIYLDDEDEIIEKKYDEPEELDIREYASSLGVDIDNINMTMVDKGMFSSGLNMTRSTLDEMSKAGYVKEVTQQGDQEFIDNGSGDPDSSIPFKPFGQNVGADEIADAGIRMDGNPNQNNMPINPYMSPDSTWYQTMPAEEARTDDDTIPMEENEQVKKSSPTIEKVKMQDPIDLLTVVKLKEVLKREGLKVSGNKEDLRNRLKSHVRSVVDEKKKREEEIQ